MTDVHQRRKMYCFALIPCYSDHFFFCFWLSSAAMPVSFQIFPFVIHCCFCFWYFLLVESLPDAFSKIRRHQRCMRILSCKFLGRCRFPCTLVLWSCKALLLASELPTFYEHFSWCPGSPHNQVQWSKYHAIFWHCRASVFRWSTFVFLFASTHTTYLSKNLSTKCLVWRSFASLSVASRTMKIHPVVFNPISWTKWTLSTYLTLLGLHQRSCNRQWLLQHYIQWRTCSPGHVKKNQWHRKWFFSRHVQFDSGFHMLTLNEIAWNGPEIMSSFTIMPRGVLKWCWRRPVWFSEEISLFFSSVWAITD